MLVSGAGMTPHSEDPAHWKELWEDGRHGDKGEHYCLYQKVGK